MSTKTVAPRVSEKGSAASPDTLWADVQYLDGDLGMGLDQAKTRLRADAKALGLVVRAWHQTGTKVLGRERIENGRDGDGLMAYVERARCVIRVTAEVAPVGPEKWVRLSTASGPCAVEVLTTEAGRVVGREEYHQEDSRAVALGYADEALQASSGGGGL